MGPLAVGPLTLIWGLSWIQESHCLQRVPFAIYLGSRSPQDALLLFDLGPQPALGAHGLQSVPLTLYLGAPSKDS